jgi:nucleotide-binding universal stress UspA family protein
MVTIEKILCPVDFFPASERAVGYAAGLAQIYNAKIHLLHAVVPVPAVAYEFPFDTSDIVKEMQAAATREMNKVITRIKARGVDAESTVRVGAVGDAIKHAVATTKPDLIAMGTHGRS